MPSRPMSVEDLWALPRVGTPVPSPDGRFVVVPVTTYDMEENEGRTRLWRVAATGGESQPLTSADYTATNPAISPCGTRIAFVRKIETAKKTDAEPRYVERPQVYVAQLDGGEPQRLTDMPLGVDDPRWLPDGRLAFLGLLHKDAATVEATAELARKLEEDPVKARITEDRVYRYWDRWLTDAPIHHVFVLDPDTGHLVDLMPDSRRWFPFMEPAGSYDISPDGLEVAFTACRSEPPHSPFQTGIFTVPVPEPGVATDEPPRARLLDAEHEGHAMRPVYTPDGKWIVYGIQFELDFYADKIRLAALDRDSGERTVLTERWDRSVDDWLFDHTTGQLFLVAEDRAHRVPWTLDFAAALEDPDGHPPTRIDVDAGWIGELRAAGGLLVASLQNVSRPPEVLRISEDDLTSQLLTSFCEETLAELEMGLVENVSVNGHGGDQVQMFLVHPPRSARPESPPPLVHLIHGGPHGVFGDQWHWRWNAQLVAAAGYMVAMVNFHGSSGWGQEFTASILGRWGDQPYDDIIAATEHLVERGLVDPDRMAVTGGSYGGYLVAWIVSQTDRFRCAINHAGVADFQAQFASDVTQGRRRSMGGELWDDLDGLDRYNPVRQARGFSTPMLVIHGERDHRVPYTQGIEIYNIYKAMDLPARLVVFPDENHWILKPQNSRLWYGEFLGWLRRWLEGERGDDGDDTDHRDEDD